jgi:hypothetical protein
VLGAILVFGWLHRFFSGWNELASAYRTTSSFRGTPVAWHKLTLGASRVLNFPSRLAADRSGLYITAFPLFRPFNPPLFVPWNDLSFREVRSHTSLPVRVHFQRAPGAHLVITEALASRIALASGGSFPGVTVA